MSSWLFRSRAIAVVLSVVTFGVAGFVRAQGLTEVGPPWHEPPMVPLPERIRSLEVNTFDTPVFAAPAGARRGSLKAGTRLAIFGSRRATGSCNGRWFLVGALAWVCGEHVQLSPQPPGAVARSTSRDGLPYHYYFAGADGAFAYSALSLVGEGIPDSQLEPGFAVAGVTEKEVNGEKNIYTTNGLWVPLRDLTPIRGTTFEGVKLDGDTLEQVAWVVGRPVFTLDRPFGKRLRQLSPLTRLRVTERSEVRRVIWFGTADGDWVRASDVRAPDVSEPPQGVRASERWLDVDTGRQILTAYVGTRAVFTTLVSTGKGKGDSEYATPLGEHRIWVKLASSDMTNVEDQTASQYYAIEAVPWVQFFKAGYGLHAAFWHEAFGTPRSHGCVNLSPKDAAFLFEWTAPDVPTGWHAALPSPVERGTLVRVR